MSPRDVSVETVLEALGANPARIGALMADASPEARRARRDADGWSALEIFAHVRACADVWGGHIRSIVEDRAGILPAGNPRAWAADEGYADTDFAASFARYDGDRAALVGMLRGRSPDEWARSAVMVGASSRVERSVLWHADHIARHEDQHVSQIRRTLASGSAAGARPVRRRR